MKALLLSTLLFIVSALAQAQQAQQAATSNAGATANSEPKTSLFQSAPRAPIPLLNMPVFGPTAEEKSRLDAEHAALGEALLRHDLEKQAAALRTAQAANAAVYEARKAEIQRQLEVRLAQIRATSYVTPAPTAPVQPRTANREPRTSSTTTVIHSAGQGVYTTHGGAAGGATITQPVPGVWEVRSKDGTMQRVLKP